MVIEGNVPLLSSFILSSKKWRLKFHLSFFPCFEKCPMTPLSITLLKKCRPLLSSFSLAFYKKMAAKFSPSLPSLVLKNARWLLSLAHSCKNCGPCFLDSVFPTKEWRQNFLFLSSASSRHDFDKFDFFYLSMALKKMRNQKMRESFLTMIFYLWLWKKMRDSKKCENLFSQCWWAPDWLRLTHNSINFTTKIWKISKFKNVMHPEKRHPYPKFYCDSMKEETKNWSLTFFQALKINVFCTLSSVVIQLNVPLLASFILSSKKMAAKFSLLFLRLSWKMPDDSSLSHTLEKMAAFAFFIKSFLQKNGGKISSFFLRFV